MSGYGPSFLGHCGLSVSCRFCMKLQVGELESVGKRKLHLNSILKGNVR